MHLVCDERSNTSSKSNDTENFVLNLESRISSVKRRGRRKENKVHICNVCQRSFSQHVVLIRHIRTHNGEKPFSCQYCEKSFAQAATLKNHELIHSGQRPFNCTYCEKRFRGQSARRTHELTHMGIKPFQCKYCKAAFRTKAQRESHCVVHEDTIARPFACTQCHVRYRFRSNLVSHIRFRCSTSPSVNTISSTLGATATQENTTKRNSLDCINS
mmetsp:Transcript_25124/g.40593  ORF Transcript_25124/g.40593 Transcript_25124/m.40593 type:complete len:215 (+) Transcript_25124:564-1208(+)